MKRAISIALILLTAFTAALGLSACNPNRKIKNVIIVIGDGMGLKHITAGKSYEQADLAFEDWSMVKVNTGSLDTAMDSDTPTDSAAAGTALAGGYLTYNGCIGMDGNGREIKTILDYALDEGKSTGVVTTDTLVGATPGAFSGHSMSRTKTIEIALSQLDSGVNLLCGSASAEFTERVDEIEQSGYAYCDDLAALDEKAQGDKLLCQLDMYGVKASVKLPAVTRKALEFLDRDEDGFVLMVEQAHIDKYSHSNNFTDMQRAVSDLNATVKEILTWLGEREDTAILVTADHETGGLSLAGGGADIRGSWSTGNHTTADVGLFTYGFETDYEKLAYYGKENRIKNAEIFEIALGLVSPDSLKEWREAKASSEQ